MKRVFTIISLMFFAFSTAEAQQNNISLNEFKAQNPDLEHFHSIDNHHYFLKDELISWIDAKNHGDQIGVSMYIINSSDEENEVYSNLPLTGNNGFGYLIGLFQDINDPGHSEPSGGWKWVDGTSLTYSNWETNEPNNANNGEDYGQFDWQEGGTKWNDIASSPNVNKAIYEFVDSSNDILLNGTISAENNQIKNVADPTDSQDVATKNYVDSNINSFSGSYNDLTDKPTVFNGSLIGDLTGNVTSDILKLNMLTQTEIDAITPEEGMVLYNESKKKIQIYSTSSTSLSNSEFTGQYAPDDSYYRVDGYQNFIAPFTGTIYGISLYLKKKEACCDTMLDFEGNSVSIDYSDDTYQNASLNSSFWHEFTFNNPVSVIFGQSYSFYVNSKIFDLGINFAYSDGEFYIMSPNNFAEGVDLMFLVSYTVDPNSPVTLSWINLN